MTQAERRAIAALEAALRRTAPDVQRAWLAVVREISDQLGEAAMARAIASGTWDRMLREALDSPDVVAGLARVGRVETEAAYRAADIAARGISAQYGAFVVNRVDPRIITAVRTMVTRQTERFTEQVVQGLRTHITEGLVAGINPLTMARGMRGVVGLGPTQVKAVRNYRRMLEGGPRSSVLKGALQTNLRDRRADSVLARARRTGERLSPERIDKLVAGYERRMIAWAAETNARTMALEAQRVGQLAAWDQAAAEGVLEGVRIERVWIATLDNRVREEHAAAHLTTATMEGVYPSGDRYPGELDPWNCRCTEIYRTTR